MALSDVMLDCETLAIGTQPVILTLGACRFDPTGDDYVNPEMSVFYIRLDIESQTALGREIDDGTVEWWGRQSAAAQEEALGDATIDNPRYTIQEAMDQLYKFCWGAKRVWSNGLTADVIWLESAFRQVNKAAPWKYYQCRDVRTAFDIGINPNMPKVTAHNALEDAVNQAIGIQTVYRTLKNYTDHSGVYIEPFRDWRR